MVQNGTYDVFISFSQKDKETAAAACAVLEANALKCWIAPRDIPHGQNWGEGIMAGLNQSRIMVLIFSSNANASQHVQREVERAVNRGIPIIPFRIENVAPARGLEYFLSLPNWLDAFTPPLEPYLRTLVKSVRHLLDRPPDLATPSFASETAPVGRSLRRSSLRIATVTGVVALIVGTYFWRGTSTPQPPRGPSSVTADPPSSTSTEETAQEDRPEPEGEGQSDEQTPSEEPQVRRQDPLKVNKAVLKRLTPDTVHIVVSLSTQRAYLMRNEEVAVDAPISSGRGDRTPRGQFRVLEKDADKRSVLYGTTLKWFLRLTDDGVGIFSEILLGYPASHGGIRLSPEAAKLFFDHAKVGTHVDVVENF